MQGEPAAGQVALAPSLLATQPQKEVEEQPGVGEKEVAPSEAEPSLSEAAVEEPLPEEPRPEEQLPEEGPVKAEENPGGWATGPGVCGGLPVLRCAALRYAALRCAVLCGRRSTGRCWLGAACTGRRACQA